MRKNLVRNTIIAISLLSCLFTTTVYAVPVQEPETWAYDPQYEEFIPNIVVTVMEHVPEFAIDAFNRHGGQIVISGKNCDQLGIAGLTNGDPTPNGWYGWDDKTYMELTPSYGLSVMQSTVLHEFGHVFDMETGSTNNAEVMGLGK